MYLTIYQIERQEKHLQFPLLRALAIERYAAMEEHLCQVFQSLLAAPDYDATRAVFFRFTNARMRNECVEDLVKRVHGDKYRAYWFGTPKPDRLPGLKRHIENLDLERNQVVHWHEVIDVYQDTRTNKLSIELGLKTPKQQSDEGHEPFNAESLKAFIRKAAFVEQSISAFLTYTNPHLVEKIAEVEPHTLPTWQEILGRPVPYPPASTHPLFATQRES